MLKYPVYIEVCTDVGLSWNHKEKGNSEVELSDDEVRQLIDLIIEADGETNVVSLNLENLYPIIYHKLYQASYDAIISVGKETGHNTFYYLSGNLIERCEKELGFSYKSKNKQKMTKDEALEIWLDEYFGTLNDDQVNDFVKSYIYNADSLINPQNVEVVIPGDIIWMAEQEQIQESSDRCKFHEFPEEPSDNLSF